MKRLIVLPLLLLSAVCLSQSNKKFCEQLVRLGDLASRDSLASLEGKAINGSDTEFSSTFKLSGALSGTISLNEYGDNPTATYLMKEYGTDSAKAVNGFEALASQVKECLPPGKVEDVMKVAGQPQTKRFFYYKRAMIVVETYKIYRTGKWVANITAYTR